MQNARVVLFISQRNLFHVGANVRQNGFLATKQALLAKFISIVKRKYH